MRLFLLPLLAALAGCATAPQPVPPPPPVAIDAPTKPASHAEILLDALSLVGTPYCRRGSAPQTGSGCRGSTNYVSGEAAGVTVPTTAAGPSDLPGKAATDAVHPGDLVLFSTRGKRGDHAGVYVVDGRFLHARSSGGRVRLDDLQASYWQRSYISARRVLDH